MDSTDEQRGSSIKDRQLGRLFGQSVYHHRLTNVRLDIIEPAGVFLTH